MKITRRGDGPRKWFGKCRGCQAEAEAAEHEMHNITSDFREGGRFSWEVCPECGAGDKKNGYGGMIFYERKEASTNG